MKRTVHRGEQSNQTGGSGLGGKIFGLIFGLLFAGIGGVFTYFIAISAWEAVDSYSWIEVPSQISHSSIIIDENKDSPFELSVRFSYQYEGQTYQTSGYTLGDSRFTEYAEAQRQLDAFRRGSGPPAYVNPDKPTQAVLVRGRLWLVPLILFPLTFVVIGLFVIFASFSSGEPEESARQESISEAAKKNSALGRWGLVLGVGFFSIFFFAGVAGVYATFLSPFSLYLSSKNWVETPAVVEYSKVRSHKGDDSTTYSVDILYAYEFNGKAYKSNQYSFFDFSSSGYRSKNEIVSNHVKGKRVTAYVNPDDPIEAVLQREITAHAFWGLAMLIFVVVGAGGMYGVWNSSRKKSDLSGRYDDAGTRTRVREKTVSTGETVLETSASGLGRFLAVLCIAAFWNGITLFPLSEAVESWQKGDPSWFLTLFVIPFVAVGLGLLVFCAYSFLAIFNPRPRLVLERRDLKLGESYKVRWEFRGNVKRIKELTVLLEGMEVATYRRGTSTYTDKETFYKDTFARERFHPNIKKGSAEFTIPQDTMHSFDASNNKITWRIGLRGDIPRWPDVNEDFVITIDPPRVV